MAFTTFDVASGVRSFNIDLPVGQGAPNRRDDVMLVQALMRIFYWELGPSRNGGNPPPEVEKEPITVDGVFGSQTRRYIIEWQLLMVRKKANVRVDGRFDPARNPQRLSTLSRTFYAIALLDLNCDGFCSRANITNYSSLPTRPDVPGLLRGALSGFKQTADFYAGEAAL